MSPMRNSLRQRFAMAQLRMVEMESERRSEKRRVSAMAKSALKILRDDISAQAQEFIGDSHEQASQEKSMLLSLLKKAFEAHEAIFHAKIESDIKLLAFEALKADKAAFDKTFDADISNEKLATLAKRKRSWDMDVFNEIAFAEQKAEDVVKRF